jgi:hypothetical protein
MSYDENASVRDSLSVAPTSKGYFNLTNGVGEPGALVYIKPEINTCVYLNKYERYKPRYVRQYSDLTLKVLTDDALYSAVLFSFLGVVPRSVF